MCTLYPITLEEMQNIPGVGAGKAKRYGQEFCNVIKKYCEENEIERPTDMRVRTVANKSKRKVDIIQRIDTSAGGSKAFTAGVVRKAGLPAVICLLRAVVKGQFPAVIH